jgi:hypothetical protein
MKYIITESQYRFILSEQSNPDGDILDMTKKMVKKFYLSKINSVRENMGSYFFFHTDEYEIDIAYMCATDGILEVFTHGITYDINTFFPNISKTSVNDALLEIMTEEYPELNIIDIMETDYFWYADFGPSNI